MGLNQSTSTRVVHKPRLLSDNVSSYDSAGLAEWLDNNGMDHVRAAPHHPATQGKIERWHQTLKNRILLENDYLPDALEADALKVPAGQLLDEKCRLKYACVMEFSE
jgi:transposase InsO family protein